MSTCSILNRDTKEPKLFYKSNSGEVFSSLYDVLNNSTTSYEIGFKDVNEDFVTGATIPVFDKSTQEGRIQGYIRNGYLTGEQIAPNTFEATDSLAAEILESELILHNYQEYKRNGTSFEFGDFSVDINKLPETFKIQAESAQILLDKKLNKQERPVKYDGTQLQLMIESFMEKVGFSRMTIAEYKKKYQTKFGLEPDGEVFIDLQNKIIATVDGNITVDELSEEFSHFVIEAWNQDEIKRMLQTVNNTREYIEHAETYRQIYSKQISDPVLLEQAVRREVLGKMLAVSLQRDFNTDGRSETEMTFFRKLSQILRDFLAFFSKNLNDTLRQDVDNMARDIQNRLYNEKLQEALNPNQTPILTLMYSIDRATEDKIRSLIKNINQTYNSDLEKQVDQVFNTVLSTAVAANSKIDSLEDDEVLPAEIAANIDGVLDMEDFLSQVLSRFKKLSLKNIAGGNFNGVPLERVQAFRNMIVSKGERTMAQLNELKGSYKNMRENHDSRIVLSEMIQKYENKTEEEAEKMLENAQYGIDRLQADTSWFTRFFMHTGKMSNLFVRQMNIIVASLANSHNAANVESINRMINPLKEHRQKLRDFMKGGYFKSGTDERKRENARRAYELSILKEVYPDVYENMTDEEFLDIYQQYGIKELKNIDINFYKYKYLYDSGLKNQTWEDTKTVKYRTEFIEKMNKNNLGTAPWESSFFQSKVDLSMQRSKGDQRAYMEKQKSDSSPYDESGTLKKGFTAMFYGEVKQKYKGTPNEQYVVSTNPRFNMFGEGEPADRDIVFFYDNSSASSESASLAFHHMKWNSNSFGEINAEEKAQEKAQRKDNFRQEYEAFIRNLDRQELTPVQREKELRTWLNSSLMFEATEEYWDSFSQGGAGINFDAFRKVNNLSPEDRGLMERLEKNYKELGLKKQLILKKYKNLNDYKEVDIKSISQSDKMLIESIEDEMRRLVRDNSMDAEGNQNPTISLLFDKYDIQDLYKVSNRESNVNMNLAFRELFLEVTGTDFDDAGIKEYETFFKDMGVGRHGGTYANLKRDLKSGNKSSLVENYSDRARDLNLDPTNPDDIIKAFFISNSPSWYKRYDANNEYDSFIRDYHSGKIDIEKLVDDYLNSDNDQIIYNSQVLSQMQITPAFKFAVPFEPKIEDLYDEYKKTTDDKAKFEILQRMAGIENISSEYKEDISDITGNPENLKIYIMMMNLRLEILEKDRMLKKNFIFMMPQQRATNYERLESFARDKNKSEQIKDYVTEIMSFRPDDYEESYKSHKIPKYGYYRLKPEELTTDVFHSLVWGMSNANLHDQRVKHRADADAMLRAIENQEFTKGQKPTETNYYKIAKEMYDFNIHGKTVSKKIEVTVGNRTLDLSKMLFGLKNFGVFQALAFSPIVAATNLIGGMTQLTMNHIVGRRLHKGANTRALANLAKMLPSSIQDVGEFDPEARINKIMYSFGMHDLVERYANAKYNKVLRLLPQLGFSMMAITNFPLEAQTTLSKLMEYRLIDGKFTSWRQFMQTEKTKNPDIKNGELRERFDSYKDKSMYDFLDDSGNFRMDLLDNEGYKGDIMKEKVIVMGAIRNIAELTTMEIASYNEGEGGRNPLASFVLTLKKWMVLSTSMMFSGRRMDLEGEEEGLIYTPLHMYKLFKTAIKDKESFKEVYNNLDDVERMNIKTSATLTAMISTMFGIAMLLKGAADDDDEENNYLLQLSAYMVLRGLNEMGSSNIMLPESYYEAIQNPIMIGSTIKNMTNIVKFGDMGEEVQSGKYKGMDKYASGILKATFLKNPYSVSSADVIGQTRQSYEFFNKKGSLYHLFDLLPEPDKEEE